MRPILIISVVEKELSTSLVAVPAFIRVDPLITSGPVARPMCTSTSSPYGVCGLQLISAVRAPTAVAARRAPTT
ncbi:Uncharacterised protein [Actinomadura madurae]|nr:Uncharacterised protein [Actinomadura madurae]